MGVRYILEGSARRSSGRVRINAQLVDAVGGGHLWAERFDRDLADVFAVQDEVVGKIVGVMAGKLSPRTLAVRRPPANLEAYECVVRGRWLYNQPDAFKTGRLLIEKAVTLDPEYADGTPRGRRCRMPRYPAVGRWQRRCRAIIARISEERAAISPRIARRSRPV
jgi:hypothetical protein